MSLLQDVLRTQTLESLNQALSASGRNSPDDDDELIQVMSLPGSPGISRPSSRPASRPHSPTRGAVSRLHPISALKSSAFNDPLRALTTDVSQRIFSYLSIKDLARCSRVSKKWTKSQTLNYVWFQHYRKENFHDASLPPGKWTKRESKQNWRTMYLHSMPSRAEEQSFISSNRSGRMSPGSGYQTPREAQELKWAEEAVAAAKPSKVEMREKYKEMSGRKARTKGKLGGTAGMRDRGGWGEVGIDEH